MFFDNGETRRGELLTKSGVNGWGLEVVRGQEVGRVFAVRAGANVLGSGLAGAAGIDLAAQEGASPRKMAANQAKLECSATGLSLLDLDSPGGTFVNRQRLLPGQTRPLGEGDLIQLGAVQLRVVSEKSAAVEAPRPSAPSSRSRPGSLPIPFTLASGTVCRTWDDFLTASSRSWSALRDELDAGRLGAFLHRVHREDLFPATASKSLDEQLDAWLARLPTTRVAQPDLEVHPPTVHVRAIPGGGTTRSKLEITNTGYRLLRSTVRVEPPTTRWLRIATPNVFTTAETSQVVFDVEMPETPSAAISCLIVIESNGGIRRVEVRVELPERSEMPDLPAAGASGPTGTTLHEAIGRMSPLWRIIAAIGVFLGLRILLDAGTLLATVAGMEVVNRPSLPGSVIVLGVLGGIIATALTWRIGEARDLPSGAFAGAFTGILTAALGVATRRAIEPDLGHVLQAPFGAFALWIAAGALGAIGSLALIPYRRPEGGGP